MSNLEAKILRSVHVFLQPYRKDASVSAWSTLEKHHDIINNVWKRMHATRRTWRHCVDIHVRSGADSGMCMAFITFRDADECGQCFHMIWDHWWAHVANGFFRKLSVAPHEQRMCNDFRKVVNVHASVRPMDIQHARLGHWT